MALGGQDDPTPALLESLRRTARKSTGIATGLIDLVGKMRASYSVTAILDVAEEVADDDPADEGEGGKGEDHRQGQLQLPSHRDGRLKSETPLEQPLQSAADAPGPLECTAALTRSHSHLRSLNQPQQVARHGVGEVPIDEERRGRDDERGGPGGRQLDTHKQLQTYNAKYYRPRSYIAVQTLNIYIYIYILCL